MDTPLLLTIVAHGIKQSMLNYFQLTKSFQSHSFLIEVNAITALALCDNFG